MVNRFGSEWNNTRNACRTPIICWAKNSARFLLGELFFTTASALVEGARIRSFCRREWFGTVWLEAGPGFQAQSWDNDGTVLDLADMPLLFA